MTFRKHIHLCSFFELLSPYETGDANGPLLWLKLSQKSSSLSAWLSGLIVKISRISLVPTEPIVVINMHTVLES